MAHKTSFYASHILQNHHANLFFKKPQDVFMLYKLTMKAEALKLLELPGNIKNADADPHNAGSSYFELARGRLEERGYGVLNGSSDINYDSELFPEVLRSCSLWSLLHKVSKTFPGGSEVENSDYRLWSPTVNESFHHKD